MPSLHRTLSCPAAIAAAPAVAARVRGAWPAWIRPAAAAPLVVPLPLAALLLGALCPAASDLARGAPPLVVPVLVLAAVAAMETAPSPGRSEAHAVLVMLAATAAVCPLAAFGFAEAAGLPPDLGCAVVLAAAGPAAASAGVLSQHFGLSARPAVWAALLGLAAGPVLLPVAVSLLAEAPEALLSPGRLAQRAVLFGALPAAAALLARRHLPGPVAAAAADLRGVVVLALGAIGLAAGGPVGGAVLAAATTSGAEGLVALGAGLGGLVASTLAAAAFGRLVLGPRGAAALLVVGAARNVSFAWAAAGGGLSAGAEQVMAIAVLWTLLIPPLALCSAARAAAAMPGGR